MRSSSARYDLLRHELRDGLKTTVYVTAHPRPSSRLRLVNFGRDPQRLEQWCSSHGVRDAIIGGFFLREPHHRPLGEVRVNGHEVEHEPVLAPWAPERACVHIDGHRIIMAARKHLPARPHGDLLQAGPLLIAEGRNLIDGTDPEGFTATVQQFDGDLSIRHPRAALALTASEILAVCCDGRRTGVDAGLTLAELAELLRTLGARSAINLDGGGSTCLVHRGHLLNRPYGEQDRPSPQTRPVVTALVIETEPR